MLKFRWIRQRQIGNRRKPPFIIWGGKVEEVRLEEAAEFLARAIRLGQADVKVNIYPKGQVPQPSLEEGRQIRAALTALVLDKVLSRKWVVPLLKGHRPWVPGWAFWALDALGPEAQAARQAAFERWWTEVLALAPLEDALEELLQEEEEEGIRRIEWAHGEARSPEAEDYLAVRLKVEEKASALEASRALPEAPSLTALEAALVVAIHEGAWEARRRNSDCPAAFVFAHHDRVPVVYGAGFAPELEAFSRLLEAVGGQWPTFRDPAKLVKGGVSPAFVIFWHGLFEARWGALAHRLGTYDGQVLRKARALQRLLNEGATPEGALWTLFGDQAPKWAWLLEALAPKLEVSYNLGDEEEEVVEDLREYDPEGEMRLEALRQALEIRGVSAEEALENPEIQGEVKALVEGLLMDPVD